MASRNASASAFGWDFQVNAAIVLMLENITEVDSIRVEGESEDIELILQDGMKIYSQAKSVQNASSDFHNVKAKMNAAINSLADAYEKGDSKKLIYVTNSPNPFNDENTRNIFYGSSTRDYNTLPESCQHVIQSMIDKLTDKTIDVEQFVIRVIPFETADMNERYKVIKRFVDDFMYEVAPNILGVGNTVLRIWQNDLFHNATMPDTDICISKKEFVWSIIVVATEIEKNGGEYLDDIDVGDYDEIVYTYRNIINSCTERFEFATRVITDYNEFYFVGNQRQKAQAFIEGRWMTFVDEFASNSIDCGIKEQLIKIILFNILKQKRVISEIKKRVNL